MNKIALISISLLFLIIGIGCAAAADLNVNDASLDGSLDGVGDQNVCVARESELQTKNPDPELQSNNPYDYDNNIFVARESELQSKHALECNHNPDQTLALESHNTLENVVKA